MKLSLAALALTCGTASATIGVDVSQPISGSEWSCLVKSGVDFAIVRAYQSIGTVDPHAVATMKVPTMHHRNLALWGCVDGIVTSFAFFYFRQNVNLFNCEWPVDQSYFYQSFHTDLVVFT